MYTIREYKPKTEADYLPLIEVHDAAWPDEPSEAKVWHFRDSRWPQDKLYIRFVALDRDRMIVEGAYMEPHWAKAPDKYLYFYSALPGYEEQAELHGQVHDWVLAHLAERAPKTLATDCREDRTFRANWLESYGFQPQMRFPVSDLDVANFDFSRFNGAHQRVADAGVQIIPLAEVRERDPRWMEKLYEMFWEIEQDIPHTDPPVKEPYEEYVKGYENPNFWPEGWFMAIDPSLDGNGPSGEYVGVSMLAKNPAMPQRLNTWLTGVLRSHRRKGIALAMKLRAIEFAIQQGATTIRTDNEENNPMLGINKLLGFEEVPAWVDYEKQLS